MWSASWENDILLDTIIYYPECKGGSIQAIDETTGILLVMTVCRHGSHVYSIYMAYCT